MNTSTTLSAGLVLLAVLFAGNSRAGQDIVDFDFTASAGVEHDSNVGITEIDNNSGEADSATRLAAGVDVTIAPKKPLSLQFGYDYSDTAYRRFSEYDLSLHHAHAKLDWTNRVLNASLTADRFEGVLDGDDYLTLTQYSPSVSRLFDRRLYVRGAFIAAEKAYDALPERNAESHSGRLDTYLLFDGMNHYLSFSMQQTSEDAINPELDFDATRFALGYGYTFSLPLMQLKLKAQLRQERRDYLNITESIGQHRKDRRMRASLAAEIPFTDNFALEGSLEHSDNDSNLPAAAIEKRRLGVGIRIRF